jgi:hypothetical protein
MKFLLALPTIVAVLIALVLVGCAAIAVLFVI